MNKTFRIFAGLIVGFALIAGGCTQPPTPSLPTDLLAVQIETLAATGFDAIDTISASGRLRGKTDTLNAGAGFILLYDKEEGIRIEVVDPIFRPVLVALVKGEKLWFHDRYSGRTEQGSSEELLARFAGIELPVDALAPLLFGKIPPGKNLTASPNPDIMGIEEALGFTLREKNGRLFANVEISVKTGLPIAVEVPAPYSERIAVRAEISGYRTDGMADRVRILHPSTGKYIQFRCDDQVTGEPISADRFDPLKLVVDGIKSK
jgi:hypothetical protein